MTAQHILDAAQALRDALVAENAALRALDVPRAMAVFPRKAECSGRLREALAEPERMTPEHLGAARAAVGSLRALADENRLLLERALFVQGRVIATLVRAVPAPGSGYGRLGAGRDRAADRARTTGPLTLSARA